MQWFIKYLDLKNDLLKWGSELNWYPSHMKNRYDNWVGGLGWDWCISRQRHFGVPFPVWYDKQGNVVVAKESDLPIDPEKEVPEGYSKENLIPEMDVMDTWATSSVSPQIVTNWIKDDSTYNQDLTDSVYIGSDLFIQLAAVDINSYCPDLTPVYIINLSSQDTLFMALVETGDSTGIFRSTATIQSSTSNINDILGANVGDQIKIVSKTDTAKFFSFIMAQTPSPIVSNLDIGGSEDIFHITNSTPAINWSYSDPLFSPQTSYYVQVGLDTNWTIANMWDTGEISSSDTFTVYSGSTLHEDSTYYIRVRVNNGTRWSGWIDTSFGLNSHPQMALINATVTEDDNLFMNLNDFISDSDDPDSLLNIDRKSTRLNSSHIPLSRMPSSA